MPATAACRSSSPTTRRAARCPRWGYDNQVYGWTPDGKAVALPLAARRDWAAASTRGSTRCRARGGPAGAAADADLGRRRLLAGRQADRLLAAVPRLPHLEALPGRLGAGPVHLRPRRPRATNVTTHPRTDRDPMWIGDRIYFASDRTGTLNLYSLRPRRRRRCEQLTREHDVGRALAELRTTAARSSTSWAASCRLRRGTTRDEHGDRDQRARRRPRDAAVAASRPSEQIEDFALSPKGERAPLRRARRRLHGADREGRRAQPDPHLERARQARRAGRPTARRIAFISDASGEEQV